MENSREAEINMSIQTIKFNIDVLVREKPSSSSRKKKINAELFNLRKDLTKLQIELSLVKHTGNK